VLRNRIVIVDKVVAKPKETPLNQELASIVISFVRMDPLKEEETSAYKTKKGNNTKLARGRRHNAL